MLMSLGESSLKNFAGDFYFFDFFLTCYSKNTSEDFLEGGLLPPARSESLPVSLDSSMGSSL